MAGRARIRRGSGPTAAELQAKNANGAATGSAPTFRCWWPTDHCATGPTADDAADTYSALSNPSAYALLADERGWSPDKFEQRLGDNMTLLLLRG
jgi:hypothetical protein